MATDDVEIANLALSHLSQGSVTAIDGTEDSNEADQCEQWYEPARKFTLAAIDWSFARTRLLLTPHGDPVPTSGDWSFRYVYPSTCIKMRRIENPLGYNSVEPPFRVENSQQRNAVTNGTFASDTGWDKGSGWVISGGVATATLASSDLEQEIDTTIYTEGLIEGASYILTFTATRSAGSVTAYVGGTAGTTRSTAATFTETIVAGSTNDLTFTGSGFSGTIDTVTLTPIARGKTVLCNIEDAIGVFTEDVTDTTLFDPEFDMAFSYVLAAKMAYPLTRKTSVKQFADRDAMYWLQVCGALAGNERVSLPNRDSEFITGRR